MWITHTLWNPRYVKLNLYSHVPSSTQAKPCMTCLDQVAVLTHLLRKSGSFLLFHVFPLFPQSHQPSQLLVLLTNTAELSVIYCSFSLPPLLLCAVFFLIQQQKNASIINSKPNALTSVVYQEHTRLLMHVISFNTHRNPWRKACQTRFFFSEETETLKVELPKVS